MGVHASRNYTFCIICAPSGAYYAEGIDPVRIYVEDELKDLGYEENQEMYIKKLSDNLVCSIDLISLNIIIQFKEDENITPVSYTHLDVYKRQI